MAIRQIAQLKQWFKKGAYPKEYQFADWMDSYWHKEDEQIPTDVVEGLNDVLNSKYDLERGEVLEERVTVTEERLNEHDEYLEMHDKHLKRHDDHLTEHDEHLDKHDKHLSNHDDRLDDHDQQLKGHDEHLQKHDEHLDKHDKHLSDHDNRLDDHDQQLKRHDEHLQKHDEHLDKHDKHLSDHDNRLDDHDGQLKSHDDSLKNHTKRITQNEENITTLQKATLQTVSISGTGNAITHIEKKDNNVLAVEKGNTFVDIDSEQTITGVKSYSNGLYTGYKRSSTDGLAGSFLTNNGSLFLNHTTTPGIYFQPNNSTDSTFLACNASGLYTSSNLFPSDNVHSLGLVTNRWATLYANSSNNTGYVSTGGRTSPIDGNAGVYLAPDSIDISGVAPYIRFRHGNISDIGTYLQTTGANTLGIYGTFAPVSTNTFSLGTNSNRWSNIYCNVINMTGSVYTGGKSSTSDGVTGSVLGSDGSIYLCASQPHIDFYNDSSTNYTNRLISTTTGFGMSGSLTVGNNLSVSGSTQITGSLQAGSYIGLPVATTDIQGIATYDKDHFTLQSGKVSLNTSIIQDFAKGGMESVSVTGTGNAITALELDSTGTVLKATKDSTFLLSTGTAAAATKLANGRTIWGQTFTGEGNVSGALTGVTSISASGNINLDGNLIAKGNVTAYSTSDIRLKKKVTDIQNVLSYVNQLDVISYQYLDNDIDSQNGKVHIGLIANQVQEHLPELTGKRTFKGNEYLTLNYNELSAIAIQGIKELNRWKTEKDIQIEQLENRISKLEKQIIN